MKTKAKTNLKYPSYIAWSKRIYLLKEGELLSRDGKIYKVKQIVKSVLPNVQPRILLEEVQND